MSEEKRGVGRPPGTAEDPQQMVRVDLQQTLKLQRKVRQIIEAQVEKLEEKLMGEATTREQLEILAALSSMSEMLTRNVQQTGKFILSSTPTGEEGSVASDDEILKVLSK